MFIKQQDDVMEFMSDYQGVIPDIKTNSYCVFITQHHIDVCHFKRGVFSLSHLCLPHNSCVQLALDFIDSLKKQQRKDQKQLSLF